MRSLWLTIALAFVLWGVMFLPATSVHVNFWMTMTGSTLILSGLSTMLNKGWWRKLNFSLSNILLGIAIAVLLWGIFWIGDKLSALMFNFARPQVDSIYGMKDGESQWLLTALMLFIIGPAEEIYWRGYVQQRLSDKWGANLGFIITTLVYTLVHVPSCNFMLVMAAMVAGAVWGLLYRLFPERFTAIIISHALWDVAVFIWFPI